MPLTIDKRVDLRGADSDLAKAVLEAAETLAGEPMEVRGPEGGEYFFAPTKRLANICRRWLGPPGQPLRRASQSH